MVPTLLSWAEVNGQTWSLFKLFEGQSAAKVSTRQIFTRIAQTLALIQTKVADGPEHSLHHLPRVEIINIPDQLDGIVHYVSEQYGQFWCKEDGPFSEFMPQLRQVLRELPKFGEALGQWAVELSTGGWPETIDHTDLHPNNVVIRSDGRIVIFDWQESMIAAPFFSLDELLGLYDCLIVRDR